MWDDQFQQALVAALAGRLVIALTGDKGLAQLKMQEANQFIMIARVSDGNEGLTVNDVTPDWIRCSRNQLSSLGVLPEHYVRLGTNVDDVLKCQTMLSRLHSLLVNSPRISVLGWILLSTAVVVPLCGISLLIIVAVRALARVPNLFDLLQLQIYRLG